MAYDAVRGVTVLFGGDVSLNEIGNNQTWEWNGTMWTRRVDRSPPPEVQAAMAYDAARGVTVLFGRESYFDGTNPSTWEWNGTEWTRRVVSGPSARLGHAMAYDSARGVTVLFGGNTGSERLADTWEWDGSGWVQRAVSGPSARWFHAMAYDASRGVTVLFGGVSANDSSDNDETWEWNGIAWTQRIPPPLAGFPSARHAHAMAYDAARGATVLFGGVTNYVDTRETATNETWELLGVPCSQPTTTQPVAQTVCLGGTAAFSVTATGSGPFAYRWRKDSVAINAISNPSAATATLTLANVGPADIGSYDCFVTNACGSVTSDAATLTVGGPNCCPADFNGDGVLNADDLGDFITGYFNEPPDPRADFNGDGVINADDLGDFITAYFDGC